MFSKTLRPTLTVAILVVTLTAAPALAAAPYTWESPATKASATLSGLWSTVSTWLAGLAGMTGGWSPNAVPASAKTQAPPDSSPCNGPTPGCAVNPNGKDKVGSAIDPDGRPF